MTKIDALLKRAQRIQDARGVPPMIYTQTAEWSISRATLMHAVAAFPDAQQAMLPTLVQLDTKMYSQDEVHLAIGQALAPYLDARIAIAEALMHGR